MNKSRLAKYAINVLSILLTTLLIGCTPIVVETGPANVAVIDPESSPTPVADVATAPKGAIAPPGYADQTWADIVAEAKGQTVNWYMWGGQENINAWITGFVADQVQAQYGVTLNMVPLADTVEAVNKVLGEKEAGQDKSGAVDLIWINGENFRTLRQADLLYGPWAQYLPNSRYVNWDDPSVRNDLGLPVEGYESPYGKAQMVMIYDSAKVAEPPTTIDDLITWIKANPGKFTYPAPPDFTGTPFISVTQQPVGRNNSCEISIKRSSMKSSAHAGQRLTRLSRFSGVKDRPTPKVTPASKTSLPMARSISTWLTTQLRPPA